MRQAKQRLPGCAAPLYVSLRSVLTTKPGDPRQDNVFYYACTRVSGGCYHGHACRLITYWPARSIFIPGAHRPSRCLRTLRARRALVRAKSKQSSRLEILGDRSRSVLILLGLLCSDHSCLACCARPSWL